MAWLIALTITLLIAGLVGTRALRDARRRRALTWTRQRLLTAEGSPTPVEVFLALGGTTFALELLVRRELLPPDNASEPAAWNALAEEIAAFGGYSGFLREMRELLEEFEEESRLVALHRALPSASIPARRLLQGDRRAPGLPAAVIDLDDRGNDSFDAWLDALFKGDIAEQFAGWWERRHARAARKRLNESLEQLARIVFAEVPPDQRRQRLMQRADALRRDADRLRAMRADLNPGALSCGQAVSVLLEEAAMMRSVEAAAQTEAAESLERQLVAHSQRRDQQRVGYLFFINRSLLFPEPSPTLRRAIDLVNTQASALSEELRRSGGSDLRSYLN